MAGCTNVLLWRSARLRDPLAGEGSIQRRGSGRSTAEERLLDGILYPPLKLSQHKTTLTLHIMLAYPPILYLPDRTLLSISRLQAGRVEFRYRQSSHHGIAAWTIPEVTTEDGFNYTLFLDDVASLKRPDSLAHSGPLAIKVFAVWATVYTFFNVVPATKIENGKPERDLTLKLTTKEGLSEDLKDVLALLESTGFVYVYTTDSTLAGVPSEYFINRRLFWQTQQFPYLPEPSDPEQSKSAISFRTPFSSAFSQFIYEPKPLIYTHCRGEGGRAVRHPLRPKPPAPGTAFYSRYIPDLQSFLIFRTASESDLPTLHKWMNNERVNAFWGEAGPIEHQQKFLASNSSLGHSFPVIGSWAKAKFPGVEGEFGVEEEEPFGYFEIYWVKEDRLGEYTDAADWDRGVHVLVGEEKFRGPHRVREWVGGLVHCEKPEFCLLKRADFDRHVSLGPEDANRHVGAAD